MPLPPPQLHAPPATATYWVRWPCGGLGWHECTERRYREILARPETFGGTKVAVSYGEQSE